MQTSRSRSRAGYSLNKMRKPFQTGQTLSLFLNIDFDFFISLLEDTGHNQFLSCFTSISFFTLHRRRFEQLGGIIL